MFGWIPLIGPIIDGIVSIFTKKMDTDVEKYKVDGQVDIQSIQSANDLVTQFKDDISIRIIRDIALVPPVVWSAIIGWDTIIALRWPWLQFHVADYPVSVGYIPYMAFGFLFGVTGLMVWKRK